MLSSLPEKNATVDLYDSIPNGNSIGSLHGREPHGNTASIATGTMRSGDYVHLHTVRDSDVFDIGKENVPIQLAQ